MLRVAPELRSSPFIKALQSTLMKGATAAPKAPFSAMMNAANELGDDEAAGKIAELNRRADKLTTDGLDFSEHLPTPPEPVNLTAAKQFLSDEESKALSSVRDFFKKQDSSISKHLQERWGDYLTLEKSEFETKEMKRIDESRALLRSEAAALKSSGVRPGDVNQIYDVYANQLEKIEVELEQDDIACSDTVPFLLEKGVQIHDIFSAEAAKAEKRIEELKKQQKAYEQQRDNLDLATVRSEAEVHPEWYWEVEDDIVNHRWDPDADFDGEDPQTWKANWEHVEFPFGIGPTINIPGIDQVKKMMNRS